MRQRYWAPACGGDSARLLLAASLVLAAPSANAQGEDAMPRLHHVGLNSVDPDAAITWYLKVWPAAKRTALAGMPAVEADMLLHFTRVDRPPAGAWNHDLHRPEQQSAFWHIGAFANTSGMDQRLGAMGVRHLPVFTSPQDAAPVWRSGLAPYAGTLTARQLASAAPAPPREGGFSYVVAPDGVLFEFTGGPGTRESFSHVHFFHEQPQCAANWYVEHLGMELPPVRDSAGRESPRARYAPCEASYGEAGWPSLERVGTLRQPNATVRFGNGSMGFYPRQCVGARCGRDQRLVPSRGQGLDHVAFSVRDLDGMVARLRRAGVKVITGPYPFGDVRAAMIEDPDGLSVELVERPG